MLSLSSPSVAAVVVALSLACLLRDVDAEMKKSSSSSSSQEETEGVKKSPQCADGSEAGALCELVFPPRGFVCSEDLRNSACELIDDHSYCCLRQNRTSSECVDRGRHCRFLASFCRYPQYQEMLIDECQATCQLCHLSRSSTTANSTRIVESSGVGKPPMRKAPTPPEKGAVPNKRMNMTTNSLYRTLSAKINLNLPKNSLITVSSSSNTNGGTGTLVDVRLPRLPVPGHLIRPTDLMPKSRHRNPSNLTSTAANGTKSEGPRVVVIPSVVSANSTTSTTSLPSLRNVTAAESTAKPVELPQATTAKTRAEVPSSPRIVDLRPQVPQVTLPNVTDSSNSTTTPHSLKKTLINGRCFDDYSYCSEFLALCNHPSFGVVMATHCALTCERCAEAEEAEEEECRDVTVDCSTHAHLCNGERYKSVMHEVCQKTCNTCPHQLCKDRHLSCADFAKDGFCANELYSTTERRHLCGISCGLCTE